MAEPPKEPLAEIQLEQNSKIPYVHVDYANASWLNSTVAVTFYQVDYHAVGVAIDEARGKSDVARALAPVVARVVMDRSHFVGVLRALLDSAARMKIDLSTILAPPSEEQATKENGEAGE